MKYHVLVGVISGVLTAIVIALQIIFSQRQAPLTTLETTLFSVLQFVFSLVFAWVMSRASSRSEFEEGQRRFAVAAYRRICEIDMSANRLIARIRSRLSEDDARLVSELHTLLAVALGIRQTTRSSIADWADVIGEEISAMQQIVELKDEQSDLLHTATLTKGTPITPDRLATLEKRLEELTSSLPPSLRVLATSTDEGKGYNGAWRLIRKQLDHDGFIELSGFWEPEAGFDRKPAQLDSGERCVVSLGDARDRVACLLVRDSEGRAVGLVTNPAECSYSDFASALTSFLSTSNFPVVVRAVDSEPSEHTGRIHFRVRIDSELAAKAKQTHDANARKRGKKTS